MAGGSVSHPSSVPPTKKKAQINEIYTDFGGADGMKIFFTKVGSRHVKSRTSVVVFFVMSACPFLWYHTNSYKFAEMKHGIKRT